MMPWSIRWQLWRDARRERVQKRGYVAGRRYTRANPTRAAFVSETIFTGEVERGWNRGVSDERYWIGERKSRGTA